MTDRSILPYRPCAGVVLLDAQGQVFVGRRRGRPDAVQDGFQWQMPQGGIDEGEDPLAAARRELLEETGVRSAELLAEAPGWFAYDLPDDVPAKGWSRRYRGQTQKWFAFRLTGPETEIDVETPGGGAYKPEFDAWRWEAMERLPSLVVPFKRGTYEQVVAAFRHLVP